jgi:anhydro-N-acetylmuramic acid kinase
MTTDNIFIGLMSGTSVDAVDAVAVEITNHQYKIISTHSEQIPADLRAQILDLCDPQKESIQLLAETDHHLGRLYAKVTHQLLEKANLRATDIRAIGCHGQTIRHSPPSAGQIPFSLQIGDANVVAADTNITVVADFRRKDIALGGQGAPLAPGFHQFAFADAEINRAIVNVGGISNISLLEASGSCLGFDTGPGNVLMDLWSQTHLGTHYDHNGSWAAQGTLIPSLLEQMKADSFFALPAPKSTGRELFNTNWLNNQLANFSEESPQDIQATLLSLTAETISEAILALPQSIDEVFICGGGAFNGSLMNSLTAKLSHVATIDALGISPSWVECCAFAWLAKQRMTSMAGNLTSVTGATRHAVLGAVYLPD